MYKIYQSGINGTIVEQGGTDGRKLGQHETNRNKLNKEWNNFKQPGTTQDKVPNCFVSLSVLSASVTQNSGFLRRLNWW